MIYYYYQRQGHLITPTRYCMSAVFDQVIKGKIISANYVVQYFDKPPKNSQSGNLAGRTGYGAKLPSFNKIN